MRIAMLYVCTGKYDAFWRTFYETCEEFFYPDIAKEYFVFTDSKTIIENHISNVHCYYQNKAGWPYDTLLRYNWICTIQDKLRMFDFCYFINANSRFLRVIDESIIPLPSEERKYIFWIHSHNYEDFTGTTFKPERNPKSTACIPEGQKCRAYGGGFWGGKSDSIIEMCCTLRDRISQDMRNGIIAVWHDQSHLEKFGTEIKPYDIPNGIIASEENADLNICYLIFLDKNKFGGNDYLREESLKERIKHKPKKIYGRILKCTEKTGFNQYIHFIVSILKNLIAK